MKINLKGILKGLFRETLQTLPVVGTIVTNIKSNKKDSPKGQLKLEQWDIYRIVIGLGVGYALVKGLLTMEQIQFILGLIGF